MGKLRAISDARGYNTSYSVDCPFDYFLDETDPNDFYEGWAEPNSDTSDTVWKIRRTKISGATTIRRWADGTSAMTKEWDEKDGYTYKDIT